MRHVRLLIRCAPALALVLAACGSREPAAEEGDATTWVWQPEVALEAPAHLGGCAIGDVIPGDGPELVAVSGDGRVYVARRDGGAWAHDVAAELPGEMIQVAVGDAWPGQPGDEIVAVGMAEGGEDDGGPGRAVLVRRDGDGWAQDTLFEDDALVHGVTIGDLDPAPGPEVAVVGFSLKLTVLGREGGSWKLLWQHPLPSPGKAVAPYRGGVLVATSGGTLLAVRRTPDGTTEEAVIPAGPGKARLAVDGATVLVAQDDGGLVRVADGDAVVIHKEASKLRGAVLADLVPDVDGVEAATAGYSRRVTVLDRADDGTWNETVAYEGTDRLHHLAAGDVDGDGALELLTCGYGRRLVLLRRVRE